MTRRLLMVLGATLALGGCSHWPDKGLGGLAEHHLGLLSPVLADQPVMPEHGLRFELELLSRHLDVLVLEGAELCFPATVVQARLRQTRIERELHGGLEHDAANDIIIQRQLLARLERQLDYVRSHQVCVIPLDQQESRPGELAERIESLLNRDNQFAFDSAEINPKYLGHLSEAAGLLRDASRYRLRITGHADIRGGSEHNDKLSLARAEQVARYLQIFGLPGDRIEVAAVGANDPLFAGKADHIRLVNRRVSVELIEVSDGGKES